MLVVRIFVEISGYDKPFYGAGDQDLDLVRRLEALAEHRFGKKHGVSSVFNTKVS